MQKKNKDFAISFSEILFHFLYCLLFGQLRFTKKYQTKKLDRKSGIDHQPKKAESLITGLMIIRVARHHFSLLFKGARRELQITLVSSGV